ncbi:unnamed protein product [Bursaphelenchus xylophilus]|uniref:(pine wood nematode) hypothetical protein n=1 Tax=Bursaphelenchus xylophilus TaxID=6326 RepID=A0A7I8WG41_BURXY|nr:unnamed protein product [Bursaphelenchus xylophilus]CAG9111666.1 unnamed protein product [Bursaphelenchus xylophilus]
MNAISDFFWINDLVGSFLGFALNTLLIITVVCSKKKRRLDPYARMIIVMSLNDLLFCAFELGIQHLLCVAEYKMFVNAHGFEQHIPTWLLPYTFLIHDFLLMNCLSLLPAIYCYRYELMSSPGRAEEWRSILSKVGIALFSSLICAVFGMLAVRKMLTRDKNMYMETLPSAWIFGDNQTFFLYAVDLMDWEGLSWIFTTSIISAISLSLTTYYAWKSYSAANMKLSFISARTKSLQKQFTKSILAQTIAIILLENVPAGVLFTGTYFGFNSNFYGTLIMWPLSWVSAAGAGITFYFMKDYRNWLLQALHLRQKTVVRWNTTSKVSLDVITRPGANSTLSGST